MPPQLVALSEGPDIPLDKPILLLGRHQECDIQLASRKVSRRHCCIAQVQEYLVVRDLGSTNGIRINGVRVLEGKLKPGDELTIGNHQYRLEWETAPAPIAKPFAARQTHKSTPGDEAHLESCDEPIPIAEPVQAPPGLTSKHPGPAGNPASRILPENIELAPKSDLVPTPPRPADSEPPRAERPV
jgi:predicted component of type VI protein secretion system